MPVPAPNTHLVSWGLSLSRDPARKCGDPLGWCRVIQGTPHYGRCRGTPHLWEMQGDPHPWGMQGDPPPTHGGCSRGTPTPMGDAGGHPPHPWGMQGTPHPWRMLENPPPHPWVMQEDPPAHGGYRGTPGHAHPPQDGQEGPAASQGPIFWGCGMFGMVLDTPIQKIWGHPPNPTWGLFEGSPLQTPH